MADLFLGSIVLQRDPKKRLNRSFFALTASASVWVLTNLVFSLADQTDVQYLAALLSYGAAGALAISFLEYSIGMTGKKINNELAALLYIIGGLVTVGSMVPGIVATGVTASSQVITNGLPLSIYGLYLFSYISSGIIILFAARHKLRGMEQQKITIVLLGLALTSIVGLYFNLYLPYTGEYRFVGFGPVSSLLFVATSTYAIVRHRLFDIRLAAVRTAAYALALLSLAVIYYLLAYVVSVTLFKGQTSTTVSVSPVNIILALVLAFVFQPIKRFFDRVTNDIFYRENYKSEDFFAALSTLLSSTIDLRGLLERASHEIASTFKSEQALFFLYYKNASDHHMSAGTKGHAKLPAYDARLLDEYVAETPGSVFLTDLMPEDSRLTRMLRSHRIALVMPLRHADEITGYVLLGEHLSGNYTKRDLNVLSTISNELVIAIQNALSLHEVKELNATLQQRIDVATKELRSSNAQLKHLDNVKDEFMSMASHQLRTPLTSIKGYLSMVLEGDAGKVTTQQGKLLQEAFNSSERMVRLINDFLNVSRLQTGKFVIDKEPIDIKAVMRQEIESLEVMAAGHSIKLRLNVTKAPLPIAADESKIRQVIMNFVDNAIYYSRANSTIVINLERVKDDMAVTVVDTGIGVPPEEQSKLFTKFFRAKNARKARPDGTGVGLYLARRVISGHGGSIIFSSTEGKGSTFGFRLPLSRQLTEAPVSAPEKATAKPVR